MTCNALTLAQQLDAARAAYHDLMLGASVREIRDSNGEQVVYTAANRDSLRDYIAQLEAKLAAAQAGTKINRKPMQVFF